MEDRWPGRPGSLIEPWEPSPSDLAPGRAVLGPGSRVSANWVTLGDRQLRLGRDGKWYGYRKARRAWQPEGEAVVLDGN